MHVRTNACINPRRFHEALRVLHIITTMTPSFHPEVDLHKAPLLLIDG